MVSSGSIAIIGLALLGAFIFLRSSNNSTIVPSTNEIPIQQNPQIQILKDAIAGVQGFVKQTFKAPPVKTKVRGMFFLNGVPQSRASRFQSLPKGSRFAVNPFTGTRIALPVGPRGSSVTERFFGGAGQLARNQTLVTQGQALFTQTQDIIKDLQGQLNILQTKSV